MLDPEDRSLLTANLAPPPGFVFDAGLATTYTLDPTLLLTVPLYLSAMGRWAERERRGNGAADALPADPIALLESLRRTTERFTVYCERGGLHPARLPSPLYGLLEPMIIEVRAPGGGAFHAKLWLLRFTDPVGVDAPRLRLLVSTRNLTADRCWDMVLCLDGAIGAEPDDRNRPLADMIARLPDLADATAPARRSQTVALAADVYRAEWELPEGIDAVAFHVLGWTKTPWLPAPSDRLAVIGPFLGPQALGALCSTTRRAVMLISRPDAFASADPALLDRFERRCILAAEAESDDGEDEGDTENTSAHVTEGQAQSEGPARTPPSDLAENHSDRQGLHAKVLWATQGATSSVYVGSANPTDAAMCFGRNVEIMAELRGPARRIGDAADLGGVTAGSLGSLLVDWRSSPTDVRPAADVIAAERALTIARRALADAGLRVLCTADTDRWRLTVVTDGPVPLAGIARVRAWPITVSAALALDATALVDGQPATVGAVAIQHVTGLVAFELSTVWQPTDGSPPPVARFALNLPLSGEPADRVGTLLRAVLRDERGFLRYLLLLLGRDTQLPMASMLDGPLGIDGTSRSGGWGEAIESLPLLEALTRAFVHRPEQLHDVEAFVHDVTARQAGDGVVPPAFAEVWRVFTLAMGRKRR